MKSLSEYITESSITRDGVFAMIKNLSETGKANVEEVESGFGEKDSVKYEIQYKNGFVFWIDFLDSDSFDYGYISPDGKKLKKGGLYDIDKYDWAMFLNPKAWLNNLLRNTEKLIKKTEGESKRAYDTYQRNNKGSAYDTYTSAQRRLRAFEKDKEYYEHFLKFV